MASLIYRVSHEPPQKPIIMARYKKYRPYFFVSLVLNIILAASLLVCILST